MRDRGGADEAVERRAARVLLPSEDVGGEATTVSPACPVRGVVETYTTPFCSCSRISLPYTTVYITPKPPWACFSSSNARQPRGCLYRFIRFPNARQPRGCLYRLIRFPNVRQPRGCLYRLIRFPNARQPRGCLYRFMRFPNARQPRGWLYRFIRFRREISARYLQRRPFFGTDTTPTAVQISSSVIHTVAGVITNQVWSWSPCFLATEICS